MTWGKVRAPSLSCGGHSLGSRRAGAQGPIEGELHKGASHRCSCRAVTLRAQACVTGSNSVARGACRLEDALSSLVFQGCQLSERRTRTGESSLRLGKQHGDANG